MRAVIGTSSTARVASHKTRASMRSRGRSLKAIVNQQHASPVAAAVAVVVSATLPLLQVQGAIAAQFQWQPVAVVAQESEAPVEVVAEAPTEVSDAPTQVAEVIDAVTPAVEAGQDSAAEEAVIVEAGETPVQDAVVNAIVAESPASEEVKDEVVNVIEEEIPQVESEIAEIKDVEQRESAAEVVELVEEEASAADEAIEKDTPATPAVANLLSTIEGQLASLKAQFGLR